MRQWRRSLRYRHAMEATADNQDQDEPCSLASIHGAWRGRVQIAEDFDEPPEDIAAAFGADEPAR
jgi:hypothetical protein